MGVYLRPTSSFTPLTLVIVHVLREPRVIFVSAPSILRLLCASFLLAEWHFFKQARFRWASAEEHVSPRVTRANVLPRLLLNRVMLRERRHLLLT
jgi:hypothetical protein